MMKNKTKRYNLKTIFNYLLFRIFKTRIMKFIYLTYKIDLNKLNDKLSAFDLDVCELQYEHFLKGDKSIFKNRKLDVIKKRLMNETYKAYGILEDDLLIYSTWISYENLGLPVRTKIKLNENEALLEDSYCHPKYRGIGLHGKMNLYRLKKIHEFGRERVIAIVLSSNKPALKVQKSSGFRENGVFYAGSILGFEFTTLKKRRYES